MMNYYFYSIFYIIIIKIILVNCENFNECRRNCEEILTPKKCIYEFNVSRLNHINNDCGDSEINNCNKKWFGINGKSPGPSIEICLGDSLEVIVHNKLKTEEISFHWHGINQRNFAHMDGVSMITQCPILPFTSYHYRIVPEHTGTFYYHTHSVLQEGDGLYGSLIIRGPQELLALEKIIMISTRSSSPLSLLAQSQPPTPTALTINGEIKNGEFEVNKGNKLRLINANVFNCPVAFSIAKHSMNIVGADGNPIEPAISARKIIIFPGK